MSDNIERGAVIEWVESWLNMDRYYHPNGKHSNIPITELYALLKQIPAADVAPVKHGRWIEYIPGRWVYAKCSKCETVHDVMTNYCPNCGAKMDGGADDVVD